MTLAAAAAANRIACITQLYDEWRGFYVVQRLDGGVYVDVRPLARDEAMTYRTQSGEVLKIVYETIAPNSRREPWRGEGGAGNRERMG